MKNGSAWASDGSIFSESLRAFLRPVVSFLEDPSVSEILVNGPDEVWIEREGRLTRTTERFTEDGLLAAARNMAQFVGRPLSDEHPRLDARLPDGSRIHVVLPPMARCGTVLSIRKFYPGGLTIEDLVEGQTITTEAAQFLQVCVQTQKNMMVAGGTGSGKTTLLNVVSCFVTDEERIVTIEDSAELQLDQEHLVSLESRPADQYGRNAVGIRDLLHSALRLRPDRIIIGEVRGGECFDLLQAMNTGHAGTLSTCHANGPLETLSRLESLALLADVGIPLRALRAQVAAALDVVVCTARMRDGSRRITAISEVLPLTNQGEYRVQDIFVFTQTRLDDSGRIVGYLAPTGVLPTFHTKLIADGFEELTESFYTPEHYGYQAPRHFIGERHVAAAPPPQDTESGSRAPISAPPTESSAESSFREETPTAPRMPKLADRAGCIDKRDSREEREHPGDTQPTIDLDKLDDQEG